MSVQFFKELTLRKKLLQQHLQGALCTSAQVPQRRQEFTETLHGLPWEKLPGPPQKALHCRGWPHPAPEPEELH